MAARVVYTIPETGAGLNISISASVSVAATPLNIVNHAYWNLKGAGNGNILDHTVQFSAQVVSFPPALSVRRTAVTAGQVHHMVDVITMNWFCLFQALPPHSCMIMPCACITRKMHLDSIVLMPPHIA